MLGCSPGCNRFRTLPVPVGSVFVGAFPFLFIVSQRFNWLTRPYRDRCPAHPKKPKLSLPIRSILPVTFLLRQNRLFRTGKPCRTVDRNPAFDRFAVRALGSRSACKTEVAWCPIKAFHPKTPPMPVDRNSLPNSSPNRYYLQEAYTPPGYQGPPPPARWVAYGPREPYVPSDLRGLQGFQGTAQGSNLNPLASTSPHRPAAASAFGAQILPDGYPFTGTNNDLLKQFMERARRAGTNENSKRSVATAVGHFGNWAGEGSLARVLNSTNSTYAQQAVRNWLDLPAGENPYGSARRTPSGGGGRGGGSIIAFRRAFGWSENDA